MLLMAYTISKFGYGGFGYFTHCDCNANLVCVFFKKKSGFLFSGSRFCFELVTSSWIDNLHLK